MAEAVAIECLVFHVLLSRDGGSVVDRLKMKNKKSKKEKDDERQDDNRYNVKLLNK